jgi:hypothetical protein
MLCRCIRRSRRSAPPRRYRDLGGSRSSSTSGACSPSLETPVGSHRAGILLNGPVSLVGWLLARQGGPGIAEASPDVPRIRAAGAGVPPACAHAERCSRRRFPSARSARRPSQSRVRAAGAAQSPSSSPGHAPGAFVRRRRSPRPMPRSCTPGRSPAPFTASSTRATAPWRCRWAGRSPTSPRAGSVASARTRRSSPSRSTAAAWSVEGTTRQPSSRGRWPARPLALRAALPARSGHPAASGAHRGRAHRERAPGVRRDRAASRGPVVLVDDVLTTGPPPGPRAPPFGRREPGGVRPHPGPGGWEAQPGRFGL